MKEKPILFSVPMVRALLDGRKTMTRRLMKTDKHPDYTVLANTKAEPHQAVFIDPANPVRGGLCVRTASYEPGDVLWVREAFGYGSDAKACAVIVYRADKECRYLMAEGEGEGDIVGTGEVAKLAELGSWKPSIHLPRKFCRLRLRVTAVKAERVQDISEEDAIREGLFPRVGAAGTVLAWNSPAVECGRALAVDAFRDLWNSINGPGSWAANPWVWCYTFEVMKATP